MDFISRVPGINGVFCAGYSSTVGRVMELQKLGSARAGFDVTYRTAQALRYQKPYRQGYQAAHLFAWHILEG